MPQHDSGKPDIHRRQIAIAAVVNFGVLAVILFRDTILNFASQSVQTVNSALPNLPYAVIGKLVVGVVLLTILGITMIVAVVLALAGWVRVMEGISKLMWRGHSPSSPDEYPPTFKLRVSMIAHSLSNFNVTDIPDAYREAEEVGDGVTMDEYVSSIIGVGDVDENGSDGTSESDSEQGK